MAKWKFNGEMAAEAGKNMLEPWMSAFASHNAPAKMTEEEKNVVYNLWCGELAPLVEFLMDPKKRMPLQMRLVLTQMLAGSDKTDYHLVAKKGSHFGANEHTTWDKMQARTNFDKDVEEIGTFIFKNKGNVRGGLKQAIYEASREFSKSERQVRELWIFFKKEHPDLHKVPK